jgi:hypothetical protein
MRVASRFKASDELDCPQRNDVCCHPRHCDYHFRTKDKQSNAMSVGQLRAHTQRSLFALDA